MRSIRCSKNFPLRDRELDGKRAPGVGSRTQPALKQDQVNPPAQARLRLTVIVPAWNDSAELTRHLPELVRLKELDEVIVVDASPCLTTSEIVRGAGGVYLPAEAPNRGAQMNLGAESARGDVFIFHHADSELTDLHINAIRAALQNPAVIGGAFYRKFDQRHPYLLPLERLARLFTRYGGSFLATSRYSLGEKSFMPLAASARSPDGGPGVFPKIAPGRGGRSARSANQFLGSPASGARRLADYGRERTLDCSLPLRLFARPAPSLVLSGGAKISA